MHGLLDDDKHESDGDVHGLLDDDEHESDGDVHGPLDDDKHVHGLLVSDDCDERLHCAFGKYIA